MAAWVVATAFAAASLWLALRAAGPAKLPASSEFEIALPEGFRLPVAGAAASIALSHDGRTLVFVGQPKGAAHRMLYMRRLGDREIQPIRGTEDAVSPVFGPDGKELLFGLRRLQFVGPSCVSALMVDLFERSSTR